MIIDTHIHIYDPSRPEGVPWPPQDKQPSCIVRYFRNTPKPRRCPKE